MQSYIGRHWRGELSLPQSYWVNGILIGLPFNLYFRAIDAMFEANPPQSPSTYISWFLLPLIATFPVLIWQGVGIWRSAGKRIEAGQSGWAWVARIVILLNALFIVVSLVASAKTNYSLILASSEERAAHYEVEDHGDYVTFSGDITDASANELAPLLQKKKMEILIINGSVGGFVQPALRLAAIIHLRNIWVVAMGECDSSCTGLSPPEIRDRLSPIRLPAFITERAWA